MPGTPAWKRAVDALDSALSPRLEGAVRHDAFGVGISITSQVLSRARATAERHSRRVLHTLNLPAASDVNRLLVQIANVEREVYLMNKSLQQVPGVEGPRRPQRRRPELRG